METTIEEIVAEAVLLLTSYGLDVVGAIVILVVGWAIAGWIKQAVNRALGKVDRFDQTLRTFFASLAKYLVVAVTIVAVLNQFGVQTASLITVLGAAGLAVGLALQGTLSNVAAGVMLLIFRPFRVGDYIDAGGLSGTVRAVTLFVTELVTPDNVQIFAPNANLWGTAIYNFSYHPTRRLDMVLGIGYEDSIDRAMAAILDVIGAEQRVLDDPQAQVMVSELGGSSVNLTARIWCRAADYAALRSDLIKEFKERMDSDGISIPFPQQVVHLAPGTAAQLNPAAG